MSEPYDWDAVSVYLDADTLRARFLPLEAKRVRLAISEIGLEIGAIRMSARSIEILSEEVSLSSDA